MPDPVDFIVSGICSARKIPVTRANYLSIAYLGSPPRRGGAEDRAELPKRLQGRERTMENDYL